MALHWPYMLKFVVVRDRTESIKSRLSRGLEFPWRPRGKAFDGRDITLHFECMFTTYVRVGALMSLLSIFG